MSRALAAVAAAAIVLHFAGAPAVADELLTTKQVFELTTFTTQSGKTLKSVRVGWESYGSLNESKSNAILICHHFSGTSHAAGKYGEADTAAGYWDAIIGPGKAIDTNKYFVLSVDALANLNTGDPKVVTTGPASINPDTRKPYALNFPVVTIRDQVEVQKRLVESLGIEKLAMVGGPAMGALQTFEWAAAYPEMVEKIMPVVGSAEADGYLIGWYDVWTTPIKLDPKWNKGNYYGKKPPVEGVAQAFKTVTMLAQHWDWANSSYGRKWANDNDDPSKTLAGRFAIEAALDAAGAARAATTDANHFLYLAKASQLYTLDGGQMSDGMKKIKATTLLISQPEDMVFNRGASDKTLNGLKDAGIKVAHVKLEGARGHLDGIVGIEQAGEKITQFLDGKLPAPVAAAKAAPVHAAKAAKQVSHASAKPANKNAKVAQVKHRAKVVTTSAKLDPKKAKAKKPAAQ